MFRRAKFYLVYLLFGLTILLIIAGSSHRDIVEHFKHLDKRETYKTKSENDITPHSISNKALSPDIDRILSGTRNYIREELANYNFSDANGPKNLDDLLIEEGGQPFRSLVISSWRSGSTFVGQLLNIQPANFYHYEPLFKYKIIQIRGPPHADRAMRELKNMFECNFEGMDDYFEDAKDDTFRFTHNTRLWDICKNRTDLCFDKKFTSKFCKLFPFHSMKIVRLRLRFVDELLEDYQNLKVVLLVRDPRGVMQSRHHRSFCESAPDCWQPRLLCADMVDDYKAAVKLHKKYPGRLMVLRHEELALNPFGVSYEVMKFLGLQPTAALDEFLNTHTKAEVPGFSSTHRVSKDVAFKWKNTLYFNYVEDLQRICGEALNLWGYIKAHNASDMASKEFYPLGPFTLEY